MRATLFLAERWGRQEPVSIREIAEGEGISLKFLETILVELRDAGIVESRRGRSGGYRLCRPPEEVSFSSVIRAIDGPLAPIRCASRHYFEPCADCQDIRNCSIRWVMIRARDALADALDHSTVAEALVQKVELPGGALGTP